MFVFALSKAFFLLAALQNEDDGLLSLSGNRLECRLDGLSSFDLKVCYGTSFSSSTI